MSQRLAVFQVLGALLVMSCGDPGKTYTEIQQGQGPCDQGINLSIEGKQYFVPLTLLPRTTVAVDGAQREAIALTELLPASVLQPYSFDGKFTTDQLRSLYDCRLAAERDGAAQLTIAPEARATGYLIVEGRAVQVKDGASGALAGVCRVDALRQMRVSRVAATGIVTKVVHVADLPTEPYLEQGSPTTAIALEKIVDASGLLAPGERTSFDYRLLPVDYLDKREKAVRFPWGHGHLTSLRWVPSITRTRSVDTIGDLKSSSGVVAHHGVAGEGWASIKHLLEVALESAPDPAHTATGPDGPYTDPASCVGCHKIGGAVAIPVSCTQCHPR